MASPAIGGFPSSSSRSPFRVVNPVTDEYHLGPDLNSAVTKRGGKKPFNFFAISYVWSDWKDESITSTSQLPSWNLIRNRLLQLSTTNIILTGSDATTPPPNEPFRCWIDCKCIDQSSAPDKAYWVPRMNQVFYSARCTILLLRDFDLTGIYELYRITQCRFGGTRASPETAAQQQQGSQQHRCLFDPSCITLHAPIPHTLETLCLETLKALWNGTWRKRAWIFQEILLSERYILSWGDAAVIAYIDLETIGYMAAFLQSRHPQESWLHDFWTWCKQCAYIRQFYSENCDMEATIFQLAENLESTLPCDKYYALCGILGLDNVTYNPTHTAGQALDNMVSALTRQGRMGWMYAIPPSINEGVVFSPHNMAPFVLTRKKKQKSTDLRESFFSSQLLGVMALEMGSVNNDESFDQVLRQIHGLEDSISQLGRNPDRRPNFIKDCHTTASFVHRQFPAILFRLGYDTIGPLCDLNLLKVLFHTLDTSGFNESLFFGNQEICFWFVVIRLCFITPGEINYIQDQDRRQVVRISAQHMQRLCHKLRTQNWRVLQWQKTLDDPSKPASQSTVEPRLAVFNGTLPTFGKSVWSVQTKLSSTSLMFIAGEMQPVAPAPHEYSLGPSPYSPISSYMGSLDKKPDMVPSPMSPHPGIIRTELSDTSMSFFGVAYQVPSKSPYSTETYKTTYHDSPDEQEASDDLINRLRQGMKFRLRGSSSSSSVRIASSQAKRAKFLTFQRKDYHGQPPRPFSPYAQQQSYGTQQQYYGSPIPPSPSPPVDYYLAQQQPTQADIYLPQPYQQQYQSQGYPPPMTSALPYQQTRDLSGYEPPVQQYYPPPTPSPVYNQQPAPAPSYEMQRNPFPYGGYTPPPLLRATPSPLSFEPQNRYSAPDPSPFSRPEPLVGPVIAELDSTPVRMPELSATTQRQTTTTTTQRDPFTSAFFQDMPKMATLKDMFPRLGEDIIMEILGRHGPNLEAVLEDCLNAAPEESQVPDPKVTRVSRSSSLDSTQWEHVFRVMEAQSGALGHHFKGKGKEKGVSDAVSTNEGPGGRSGTDQTHANQDNHGRNTMEDAPPPTLTLSSEKDTTRDWDDYFRQLTADARPQQATVESRRSDDTKIQGQQKNIPVSHPPPVHTPGEASTRYPTPPKEAQGDASLPLTVPTVENMTTPSVPTQEPEATQTEKAAPEPATSQPATKTPNAPKAPQLQPPLTPEIITSRPKLTAVQTEPAHTAMNGNAAVPSPALSLPPVLKPKPAVPPKPKSLKANAHVRSLSTQSTGVKTPTTPVMNGYHKASFSHPNTPMIPSDTEKEVELFRVSSPLSVAEHSPPPPRQATPPPTESSSPLPSTEPEAGRTLRKEDSYDTLYDAPRDYTAKKKAEKEEAEAKQADAWLIDFSDDTSAEVVKLEPDEKKDYNVDLLSLLDEPLG